MKLSFLEQNTITDYNHIGAISGRCLLVQQGKSVAAPPLVGVANKGSQESLSEAPFRQINSFLISVLLGEGNGNPLLYSCLDNTMDRGALWATVHGVKRVGHD